MRIMPITRMISKRLGSLRRFPQFSTTTFEGKTDDEIRYTILQTALSNVPLLGWTDDALAKAMRDVGYDSLSHKMIASGPVDLVTHFMTKKREHVNELLAKKYALVGLEDDGSQSNADEVVNDAIEMHLDYIAPYLSSWPKALALLAEPSQIPSTIQLMTDTADDICHFAGLRSSRMDWYSDRGFVLVVFCTTELYMLTDYSENMQDTR
jgi:ubiquinone biosynthesis protein COQ9